MSLKKSFELIHAAYPTADMDFKGIQKANFSVNGADSISDLTDLTLDEDSQIIGIFVGQVHVSYAISGADTDVNVTVNRHTDFGDVDAVEPVFTLVRSKDGAADPVGDNFTEEDVVATSITIDPATNGDFVLHFDGYIVPSVPYDETETSETSLDFGDVVENTDSDPLSFELSMRDNRPGSGGPYWVAISGPKMKLSLDEEGDFDVDELQITPNEDGTPVTVWVRFSPDAVDDFDTTLTLAFAGLYKKTIALLGSGVAA